MAGTLHKNVTMRNGSKSRIQSETCCTASALLRVESREVKDAESGLNIQLHGLIRGRLKCSCAWKWPPDVQRNTTAHQSTSTYHIVSALRVEIWSVKYHDGNCA